MQLAANKICNVTPNAPKVRDIAPLSIRPEPGLRATLAREAAINGRSLHAEILLRLRHSVEEKGTRSRGPRDSQDSHGEHTLPDSERALLNLFRTLSPQRQLALMTLLKD